MNHREALELLPWYAAGTLASTERADLSAHLAGCSECQHELSGLAQLGALVRDDSVEPGFDLARLAGVMARLPAQPGREVSLWQRFNAWLDDNLVLHWQAAPNWARAAVALQLAALVGLAGALAQARRPNEFATAAGACAAAGASCIALGFEPAATERELRALVDELDAEIVGGPSALGLYTLALPAASARELEATLAALRARQGLVREAARVQ